MKKILILMVFVFSLNTIKSKNISPVYYNGDLITNVDMDRDTSFYAENPNFKKDSILVVNVSNNILTVVSKSIQNPIIKILMDPNTGFGGLIILIIAAIHRGITVRRWKKDKKLK